MNKNDVLFKLSIKMGCDTIILFRYAMQNFLGHRTIYMQILSEIYIRSSGWAGKSSQTWIRGPKYDQVVLSRIVYEVVFYTTNTNTSKNYMERIRGDTRYDLILFFQVVYIRGRIDTRSYQLVFLYE